MGYRGPEQSKTAWIESNVLWYMRMGFTPPDMADSVTLEASFYDYNRKTMRSMFLWRGCGAAEWTRLQWKGRQAAFCGGQSS